MHHRLDLAVDLFIETPFIVPKYDRGLLSACNIHVTAVLTLAIILLILCDRVGKAGLCCHP